MDWISGAFCTISDPLGGRGGFRETVVSVRIRRTRTQTVKERFQDIGRIWNTCSVQPFSMPLDASRIGAFAVGTLSRHAFRGRFDGGWTLLAVR